MYYTSKGVHKERLALDNLNAQVRPGSTGNRAAWLAAAKGICAYYRALLLRLQRTPGGEFKSTELTCAWHCLK